MPYEQVNEIKDSDMAALIEGIDNAFSKINPDPKEREEKRKRDDEDDGPDGDPDCVKKAKLEEEALVGGGAPVVAGPSFYNTVSCSKLPRPRKGRKDAPWSLPVSYKKPPKSAKNKKKFETKLDAGILESSLMQSAMSENWNRFYYAKPTHHCQDVVRTSFHSHGKCIEQMQAIWCVL